VRLDHLLSKEHLALVGPVVGFGDGVQARCPCRTSGGRCSRVEHRLWPAFELVAPSTPQPFGVRVGTVAAGVGGRLGTLLGPEGTAGRLLSRGRYELSCCLWVVGGLEGLRAGTARSNRSCDQRCKVLVVGVGAGVRVPEPVVA
jgi:hypothetical protein